MTLSPSRRPQTDLQQSPEGDVAAAAAAAAKAEERALIRRAQAGDREAFRQLVQAYEQRATWAVYHMIGHMEEARDIVQEGFLRVWKAFDRFDADRNFYTWFYRILHNLAVDAMRRRKVRRAASLDDVGDLRGDAPSPGHSMSQQETAAAVHAVLQTLPPAFREVMVLRELQGMSALEIARSQGANPSTVRWRLHRARHLFRESWERVHGDQSQEAVS